MEVTNTVSVYWEPVLEWVFISDIKLKNELSKMYNYPLNKVISKKDIPLLQKLADDNSAFHREIIKMIDAISKYGHILIKESRMDI